jgi:histidinol dehydrogenase
MAQRLRTKDSDFEQNFTKLLHSKRESSPQIYQVVADILADVRMDGDDALIKLTKKFDRVDLQAGSLRITGDEIEAALKQVEPEVLQALEFASQRIKSHHEKQKPEDHIYTDELGVKLGTRWTPVDAVGIYVPGGLASYPSSVLMNALPAKVAGVVRIAMVVPTPDGKLNPAVLAAARIAGVSEIYRIGGAQGVGALAYGTKTIAPVDKIVGPGNAYVAEAKRQVFGTVGIDMIAGPSEILVIADDSANPAWIAADLLAQAEHGAGAQSIAMVTSEALGDAVAGEVERQLKTLSRNAIAAEGWDEFGAIIVVEDIARAVALSNRLAPEHLELALDNPENVLPEIRHAGSIFMGHHTPEAVGDYVAGPNHVLPTARSARYASALGTIDFMKRSSILNCPPGALARLAQETVTLAEAEDLQAHGRSVSIRLNS